MARLDAYADVESYRDRNGMTSEADPALGLELLHVSRLADAKFGVPPGFFNFEANVTRYFSGWGDELLFLEDEAGRLTGYSAIDPEGIQVDTGEDGTFSTTFDLSDGWVQAEPRDAPLQDEVYTQLRLVRRANAVASVGEVLTRWPKGHSNIRVIGSVGSPVLNGLVGEYVILRTRDLRDAHLAGGVGALNVLDDSLPISSGTWRIKVEIERQLSKLKRPAIA